ncbi:hypothetical protein CW304_23365 [Bacillus sp. UFRGS-B20]|nr:hypothetical protein CW304_23365 [Bacillus sp. UFRGS-B20]
MPAKYKFPHCHFYEVLNYSDIERNKQLKDQIFCFVSRKNIKKFIIEYAMIEKENITPSFSNFFQWQYYVAAYVLKKNPIRKLHFRIKKCSIKMVGKMYIKTFII